MRRQNRSSQAGFSMIEMLMTAFVLAVGLLGLAMLQTMSLRASRGSRSLTGGVQVAESVMDRIEMEGRLSWLNLTTGQTVQTTSANLTQLRYMTLGEGASTTEYFSLLGSAPDAAATDPAGRNPFYTVTTTRGNDAGNAAGVGNVCDFTVVVQFTEQVTAGNVGVPRTVTLVRRIFHG